MGITESSSTNQRRPLLDDDAVDGSVDHKDRPVFRSSSGGWRSASLIIGVEVAERFAYYGISCNLITFLTGPLHQSVATAAANVNAWSGTGSLMPLLGAFVADSFLGRYRTIVFASLLYILGLGLLAVSALSLTIIDCHNTNETTSCSSQFQVILFFFALYIVAVAQGGHRPCVQAFGADQFDEEDPQECKAKSSFFNWWYFSIASGVLLSLLILTYIQDNLNWVLGFGIPCLVMVLALVIFSLGTRTYRFKNKGGEESPFVRIGRVFVVAIKNWRTTSIALANEEEALETLPNQVSEQFKFLNKAFIPLNGAKEDGNVCSITEVDEAKQVFSLVPIWATSLAYAVVYAQSSTFYTKQGVTIDRTISPGFILPAATLQSFVCIAAIIFIPVYDRIIVPLARVITRKPAGITMLQRIGTGMVLSTLSITIAALVEIKRLKTAREHGLIDLPNVTIPMSIWWMVPQYSLFGVAEAFTMVGLQEFFYSQVPNELRSVGLSLYLSIFGVGSFLSSFIVSLIENITNGDERYRWFADNLNKGHLDYFYWLLAGFSAIGLAAFVYFAKSYVYRRA